MKIDVVEILDENVRAETQFGTIYGKMITDSAFAKTKVHKYRIYYIYSVGTYTKPPEGNESACRGTTGRHE